MFRIGSLAGAAALVLLAATSARAQVIRGELRDLSNGKPIERVTVAVRLAARDSVVGQTLTSDSGRFAIFLKEPGKFQLLARRVGWFPVSTEPFSLRVGDTLVLTIEMAKQIAAQDTIVSKETRGVWEMTPGKEFVRKHYAMGVGTIISGWEMERSGLTVSSYLGNIPGLRLSAAMTGVPTLPMENHQILTSLTPSRCIYGRIDRQSILFRLMRGDGRWLDDILKVKDILAVEVYLERSEVPAEWAEDSRTRDLYARNFHGGGLVMPGSISVDDLGSTTVVGARNDYLIGHTGFPEITPDVLADDALAYGTTRITMREDASIGVDASKMHTIPEGCGFVQIWTSVAW